MEVYILCLLFLYTKIYCYKWMLSHECNRQERTKMFYCFYGICLFTFLLDRDNTWLKWTCTKPHWVKVEKQDVYSCFYSQYHILHSVGTLGTVKDLYFLTCQMEKAVVSGARQQMLIQNRNKWYKLFPMAIKRIDVSTVQAIYRTNIGTKCIFANLG